MNTPHPDTKGGALPGDTSGRHTPGPWGVQDDHGRRYVETLQGNDDSICEVHKRGNKGEYAANARLIAVAPELLETLKRLEVAANSVEYCYDKRPENFAAALQALKDDASAARAAIAKATGGAA